MKLFLAVATLVSGSICASGELMDRAVEQLNVKVEGENLEWLTCTVDDDCVNIRYPCAGGTVNKKFAKKARELYARKNAARDCFLSAPKKNDPPFKVFCINKKCGSQGRNPKMGFS